MSKKEESTKRSSPKAAGKRVGLRDIAQVLGVSKITVSRALRGISYVEASLKKKIIQEAARQGYELNPVISETMGALRHSRKPGYRETVACLAAHEKSSYTDFLYQGIGAVADRLGYGVDYIGPDDSPRRNRRISGMLRARGIRGVLILPTSTAAYPHITLDWADFSAVLIGSSLANRGLTRIQFDHYGGVKLVLRKLQHAGYRRIGMILGRSLNERTNRQIQAAFEVWHPLGDKARTLIFHFRENCTTLAVRKWLAREKIDCVIGEGCSWLDYLQKSLAINVPEDCAFASLTVAEHRSLTGVQTSDHFIRTGAEAMRQLDLLLSNGIRGLQDNPMTLLIPPDWQSGKTAPKI